MTNKIMVLVTESWFIVTESWFIVTESWFIVKPKTNRQQSGNKVATNWRYTVNKKIKKAEDEISKFFNDPNAVKKAMQTGINEALLKHKKLGNPICVWRNDEVVWIAAENIKTTNGNSTQTTHKHKTKLRQT